MYTLQGYFDFFDFKEVVKIKRFIFHVLDLESLLAEAFLCFSS